MNTLKYMVFFIGIIFMVVFSHTLYAGVVPGTIRYETRNSPTGTCNSWDSYITTGCSSCSSTSTRCTNYSDKDNVFNFTTYSLQLSNDNSKFCRVYMRGTPCSSRYAGSSRMYCCTSYSGSACIRGYYWDCRYDTITSYGSCSLSYTDQNFIEDNANLQIGGERWNTRRVYSTSICTLSKRYATLDREGPTVTYAGVGRIFSVSDDNQWCNIRDYRSGRTHSGCQWYVSQHGGIRYGDDLLRGLSITLTDDSGIRKVVVRLGRCSYTYSHSATLSQILVNTTSPSGVLPGFKTITIPYEGSITLPNGQPRPGLRNAFGVSRLDQCLSDGQNFLSVEADDMARAESDGVSEQKNTRRVITQHSINIDTTTPLIRLSGNLSGTINSWRNFTITGGVEFGEKYSGALLCSSQNSGTGKCTGTLGPGEIWILPVGVHPITGDYRWYECDGRRYPTNADCVKGTTGTVISYTGAQCGTLAGATLDSFPLFEAGDTGGTDFCALGEYQEIDFLGDDGEYNWNCVSSLLEPEDVCGDAHRGTYTSYPSALCARGTVQHVDQEGLDGWYNWACSLGTLSLAGCNSTTTSSNRLTYPYLEGCVSGWTPVAEDTTGNDMVYNWRCERGILEGAICGTLSGQVIEESPLFTAADPASEAFCRRGQYQEIDFLGDDGEYNWNCVSYGVNLRETCGQAHTLIYNTYPTSDVCTLGTVEVTDSDGWDGWYNWNCVQTMSLTACNSAITSTGQTGYVGTGWCTSGTQMKEDESATDTVYNWRCVR